MKTTVNQRVKILRESFRMTQAEFAMLVESTTTSLSRIENGESEPRAKTLKNITDATGVTPQWLIEGKGEMFLEGNLEDALERLKNPAPSQQVAIQSNPWQDITYKEMKEEITYLREMLRAALGAKANFRKASDVVYPQALFPGKKQRGNSGVNAMA